MKKAILFKQTYVDAGGERYLTFIARALSQLDYCPVVYTNYFPLRSRLAGEGVKSKWFFSGFEATSVRAQLLYILLSPVYLLFFVFVLVRESSRNNSSSIVMLSTLNEKILFTLPARLFGYRVYWVEVLNIGSGLTDSLIKRLARKSRGGSKATTSTGGNIWTMLYLLLSRYVAAIIVASESVRRDFEQLVMDKKKIQVLYHGVSVAMPGAVSRDRSRPHSIVFITIARLHPEKGIDILIRSFARLRHEAGLDARLVVVGDGVAGYDLVQLAHQIGVGDQIDFVGYQSDVFTYLNRADIFVLPSRVRESFGISIVEAMLSECAVIASRIGGIPEIVQDQESGLLVEPGSEEALFQAMHRLAIDERLRQEIALCGRGRVEQYFSLAAGVGRLKEIL